MWLFVWLQFDSELGHYRVIITWNGRVTVCAHLRLIVLVYN